MYSRNLDGNTLTLAPSGWTYKNTFVLYDKESGSLWYPDKNGLRGISGEHFNRYLPLVNSKDTAWKKWIRDYPDTKIMK